MRGKRSAIPPLRPPSRRLPPYPDLTFFSLSLSLPPSLPSPLSQGHLGASLGVTELTVALHYVFAAPEDRIVWDVGHQVRRQKKGGGGFFLSLISPGAPHPKNSEDPD